MDNYNTERKDKLAEFMLTPRSFSELTKNSIQTQFCNKNSVTELSSDFTLPDYLPEIKKMLRVSSRISPLSRYIGGNNVEFSGHIDYELLYADNNGHLNSALLGDDFAYDVTLDTPAEIEWDDSIEAVSDIDIDMLHCRVLAPRKINIKCRLQSSTRAYGNTSTSFETSAKGDLEQLLSNIECCQTDRYMSEIIEIAEELVPETPATNLKIKPISSTGTVSISDCIATDGALNCRGDLTIKILCEYIPMDSENYSESEAIPSLVGIIRKKIPFNQQIDAPKATTECECCAFGSCTEIHITESDGKLFIETEMILQADTFKNVSSRVTQDIFSTSNEGKVEYKTFSYENFLKSGISKISVSESVPLSNLQLSPDSKIIDSGSVAKIDNIEFEDGFCKINGVCRIKVPSVSPDGKEYSSGETSISFGCTVDLPNVKNPSAKVMANVEECSCQIENEQARCEVVLSLPYSITNRDNIRIVSSANFDKAQENKKAGVTVYYPTPEDTLWSVAKRYGVSIRTLAELNNLSSLKGEEKASKPFFIISR